MALLQRSNAAQEDNQEIRVPFGDLRNSDGSIITGTASAGVYGIVSGGWGVGGTKLQGEAASNNSKTSTTKFTFRVPQNYVAGTNLTIKPTERVSTPANTTASVDVQAYKSNENGGVSGSNLITTSAITHNSATWIEQSFTLTSALLSPGDELDIYIRQVVNDAGGATGAKSELGGVIVAMSTKM